MARMGIGDRAVAGRTRTMILGKRVAVFGEGEGAVAFGTGIMILGTCVVIYGLRIGGVMDADCTF